MAMVNFGVPPSGNDKDAFRVTQFQTAWQEGRRPRLEDYLPPRASRRAGLLPALVCVDLVQRLQCGESVRVEAYLSRYPELQKDRDAVLRLIAVECSQRKAALAEYQKRFPQYASLLSGVIEAATAAGPSEVSDAAATDPWSTFVVQPVARHEPKSDSPPAPIADDAFSSLGKQVQPKGEARDTEARQSLAEVRSQAEPGNETPRLPAAGEPASPGEPKSSKATPPTDIWATFDGLRLADDEPKVPRAAESTDKEGPRRASAAAADAPTEKNRDRAPECTGAFVPASSAEATPERTGSFTPAPSGIARTPVPPPAPSGKFPSIEGYELLSVLGRGGMGVVYKARHIKLKRLVALKMILAGVHAGEQDLQRFRTEAEAVARLQHPNIVQIHEIGSQDSQPFFSLEFVDGGSLDRKLAGKPQPVLEAASMLETLADAMQFAHERGVIHRDLKPANVLLTKDGQPKITDFGLAKQTDSVQRQTETGSVMGTPAYMPPEQAMGDTRNLGPAADIYSLGAILYELLTGQPPFRGDTAMDTLIQVQTTEPKQPSKLRPRLPRDLETICLKCLEKSPARRYATAAALADDLRRFMNHEPILARRVPAWERGVKWLRRHPAATACLTLLVLSVTGALAAYGVQQAQEQHRRAAARKRIDDQLLRAQEAEKNEAWASARDLLLNAGAEAQEAPDLADQDAAIQQNLQRVRQRLEAVARLQDFARARDNAIFHATLSGGETGTANAEQTRASVREALECVGLKLPVEAEWVPDSAFTVEEQADVRRGCYELLLTLADVAAQTAPNAGASQRREHAQEALQILAGAEHVGVATRAYHLRRARYLAIVGDMPAADRETQLAGTCPVRAARDHYLVGEEYYKRGDVPAALAAFKESLRMEGDGFWASYFLALCHVKRGEPHLAVEPLNYCLARKQGLTWIHLLRGFVYGQLGNFSAAEADFSEVLARAPTPDVLYVLHNNRAVTRVGQKHFDQAAADLKQAIKLKPDQYQAYASLAQVEFLQGHTDEAVAAMDQAVKAAEALVERNAIDASNVGLLYRARSRFQVARKDVSAGLSDLDRAVALEAVDSPVLPGLQGERGRLLHRLQRFSEAILAYTAALDTANPNREVHRWMAEALVAAERYADAVDTLQQFTHAGGTLAVKDYQLLALAHHKVGDLRAAIDDLTKILEREPDNVTVLGQRGQLYLVVRAYTLASRDFDRALTLSPGDPAHHEGRGFAQAKLGHHQKAASDAEEALRHGPYTSRQAYRAARTLAQAAGQIDVERAPLNSPVIHTRRSYEERSLALLREALHKLPEEQRPAFWRNTVRKDPELEPLYRTGGYIDLERKYLNKSGVTMMP